MSVPHVAMYSLYRAWLLRESSPPDVVVCVGASTGQGSHQFSGHRNVLSSQSGYLKSLLGESRTPETAQTRILVPNVSPEVFAPLLTFMYTGYLDLTPDNIYGVLLATHLLHMPRALDLCRSYLLQQQHAAQSPPPPPLIKPIPSRKMLPVLLPPPPPPATAAPSVYWPPPTYHPLPPLCDDSSGYRSVFPLALSKPETQTSSERPSKTSPLALPSTSDGRPGTPPSTHRRSAPSPSPSQTSDSSDRVTVTVTHRSESKKRHGRSVDGKVIVDVACCDGPVRFHRVLNRNYGLPSRKESVKKNRAKSSATENENGSEPEPEDGGESAAAARDPEAVFTCRFCNHTFKSQYCYQKHARRHINPVDPEVTARTSTASSSAEDYQQNRPRPQSTPVTATARQKETPTPVSPTPAPTRLQDPQRDRNSNGQKREVRLLDMNVQYYPCKTCGSKFPSYYFVHKHRKMCHPGDDSTTPTSQDNNSSTG